MNWKLYHRLAVLSALMNPYVGLAALIMLLNYECLRYFYKKMKHEVDASPVGDENWYKTREKIPLFRGFTLFFFVFNLFLYTGMQSIYGFYQKPASPLVLIPAETGNTASYLLLVVFAVFGALGYKDVHQLTKKMSKDYDKKQQFE